MSPSQRCALVLPFLTLIAALGAGLPPGCGLAQPAPDAGGILDWLEVETRAGAAFDLVAAPAPQDSPYTFGAISGDAITGLWELARTEASGKIAFHSERGGPESLFVMNADGSEITGLGPPNIRTAWPDWSPDGQYIAFERGGGDQVDIWIMRSDGSDARQVTNTQGVSGKPDWSPDGKHIVFYSNVGGSRDIYVMNADGTDIRPVIGSPDSDEDDPDWCPDGRRIALRSTYDGNAEIYVCGLDGSNAVNLTHHPANDFDPVWSPDGTKIAFMSERGNFDIYVMDADGSNLSNVTDHPAWDARPAWSPEGTQILFDGNRDGPWDIYVIDADGSNVRNLTNDRETDHCATWSPREGGTIAQRCLVGPDGADDGWDPSLGESRQVVIAAWTEAGLHMLAAVTSGPGNAGVTGCEPVSLSPNAAALKVVGQGLTGIVEDRGRGMAPQTWECGGGAEAEALYVVLSGKTGRVASVVVSSDTELTGAPETADSRILLRGTFIAALSGHNPDVNLVSDRATEIALDAETGRVVLVKRD